MSWGITTGMQIVISTEEQTASDELRKKITRQAARSKKQTARSKQPNDDSEKLQGISE